MEIFSKKFVNEFLKKKSGIGFRISFKGFIIFCLFFADDGLIFCKAEKGAAEKIRRILEDFCYLIG